MFQLPEVSPEPNWGAETEAGAHLWNEKIVLSRFSVPLHPVAGTLPVPPRDRLSIDTQLLWYLILLVGGFRVSVTCWLICVTGLILPPETLLQQNTNPAGQT